MGERRFRCQEFSFLDYSLASLRSVLGDLHFSFLVADSICGAVLSINGAAVALGIAIIGTAIQYRNYRNRLLWYYDQQHVQVQLSKGDRFVHVWLCRQKKSIAKADIVSIEQHFYADSDDGYTTWIPLYTQIDFQNGDTLNMHRMLMPQQDIKMKFHQEAHFFQEQQSNKRGIQKKTSMNGYFPEAYRGRYEK